MAEGWAQIAPAGVVHYLRNGRSLCGRWSPYTEDLDNSDLSTCDDCQVCDRVLRKEATDAEA